MNPISFRQITRTEADNPRVENPKDQNVKNFIVIFLLKNNK